ncbi:MAG: amylo-alpha-1,6-glucosidase [Terriglobales bacterium]
MPHRGSSRGAKRDKKKSKSQKSKSRKSQSRIAESKSSTDTPRHAQGRPTNIASAIVIKDEELFLLCETSGGIPLGNQQGFGLYYHDCRFLNGYELTIGGVPPNALMANSERGFMAEFELTNRDLTQSGNGQSKHQIKKQSLGLKWQRVIQASQLSLQDVITCTNYTVERVEFVLSFTFRSGFEDIFEIRGLRPRKTGREEPSSWRRGALLFEYDGADGLYRSVSIKISPTARSRRPDGADLRVSLGPGESKNLEIAILLSESSRRSAPANRGIGPNGTALTKRLGKASDNWMQNHCQMRSNSRLLNNVFRRSIRDLGILKTSLEGHEYFSAGLPWYAALFGRDSIIASLQTLAFRPDIAQQTLRLLAKYQGREVNDWRDEEPGKIMHELRVGELAHLNEIPQTPYYGSVDVTPLYLILMARYANWTGDLSLFRELKTSVDHAFDWITRYGDKTGDGYLQYDTKSKQGLGNQGWKDSGDAIVNADGTLAKPPIALVEVQGYVYLAKMSVAELYDHDGGHDAAKRLRAEAHELQDRFERDFWIEDKEIYALALQSGKKPASVVSSNAGQSLWSGIAQPSRAKKTVGQMMSPAMFGGWGIRTLSGDERRFNPVGYHLGTVWPHDNAIIVGGMRSYGCDEEACSILSGIVQLAQHFDHYRLPEVFAGFSRKEFQIPVRYPVACHPQAWAAGSVPFMLESLLGLVPRAFESRLEILRPTLPKFIQQLELQRLRVGKASVDLKFVHGKDGMVSTHVLKVRGKLDVDVSPGHIKQAA